MLIDIKVNKPDAISILIDGGRTTERLRQGVYMGGLNFDNQVPVNLNFDEKYPNLDGVGSYGVCDNPDQLFEKCEELENSLTRAFVVSFASIKKSEQYEEGGWRWHKWGEYIGDQNPQHEYLYDEDDIEEVFVYTILEVTSHVKDFLSKAINSDDIASLEVPVLGSTMS